MMNWYFALGDLDFFWKEQLHGLSWLPQVFRYDNGFGESALLRLWLDYPFRLFIKILDSLGFSWFFIEKILWGSVFVLAIYSSYRLALYISGKSWQARLTAFIYTVNSYFLLLFSGGQLGVALAYALIPLVLFAFIKAIDQQKEFSLKSAVLNGLVFALLVCFDLRSAYLTLGVIALYVFLYLFQNGSKKIGFILKMISTVMIITVFIHAFWILPVLLAGAGAGLGEQFTGPGMLKFLSFADFSHALSFLHPNWPENLFGKIYFLRPEYLIIPILAFSALLNPKRHVRFFAIVAFIGTFFAKGVNDPFGGIFQWMFIHIPGFVMFRDPTKFYQMIALGYSMLIPITLDAIGRKIDKKLIILVFLAFWAFILRDIFTGSVGGNFKPIQLTQEYISFKNILVKDSVPSRTLWIPDKDPFAYKSVVHPILTSGDLFQNASLSALLRIIKGPEFISTISKSGVKYIVVPEDPGKRIFLNEYKADPKQRMEIIDALLNSGLPRMDGFSNFAVFENTQFTMQVDKPQYVTRQTYYANIGLALSALSIIAGIVVVIL